MESARPLRARIIDELRALDEFEDPLLTATQTSVYERKQALKEGMPASFVRTRREELEGEYWTRLLGSISSPVLVGMIPVFFDYSRWVSDGVVLLTAASLALLIALLRAHTWSQYRKRVLLYDLLATASDSPVPEPEEQPDRASALQHPA